MSPLHDPMSNHVVGASNPQIVDTDSINKTCEKGWEGKSIEFVSSTISPLFLSICIHLFQSAIQQWSLLFVGKERNLGFSLRREFVGLCREDGSSYGKLSNADSLLYSL